MSFSEERARLKNVPIIDYLASKGHQPEKMHRKEYVYYSPLRIEGTPSFFVNPEKNLYKDYGEDGGDIFKLVMKMETCDFSSALRILKNWEPGNYIEMTSMPSFSKHPDETKGIEILKVQDVNHLALINYLKSRKIPFYLAARYLKEVHYLNRDRKFFSLGFPNSSGGWAIRNERFKGCFAPNGVSHLKVEGSKTVTVFEGFFDFLSALTYFNLPEPKNSVVVLNSTSNLKASLDTLGMYQTIYTFLDNDDAGNKVIDNLKKWKFPICDRTYIYKGHKDFSDFLNKKQATQAANN